MKERQLQCLANVDPVLCAGVAAGLGLPTPEATLDLADVVPSPTLSQIGRRWPTDGRIIGIIADSTSDLGTVREARDAIHAQGMLPMVIASTGGTLTDGSGEPVVVQRAFLTARSIEFDALLVSSSPAPAPDAVPTVDAKAHTTDAASDDVVDPRVTMMLAEAFRHAKAIGAWGDAETALTAGLPALSTRHRARQ